MSKDRHLRADPRVVASVLGLSGVLLLALLAAGSLWGDTATLFLDTYETTGSRLAGIGSNIGVLLWASAASICLFGAWLARREEGSRQWSRVLAVSALLTLLLLADDYLGLHEAADDTARALTGIGGSTLLRNASELVVFALLGLAFLAYVLAFRRLLARTEIGLLIVAAFLLGCSLAVDMLPRSWPAAIGLSAWIWDVGEEGLKLAGIAMYLTYYVRTTAMVLDQRWSSSGPDHPEPMHASSGARHP